MNQIKPWVRGLIDGLTTANLITSTIIEHKNRIALIILDSTLEIAFKDYILHEKKIRIDKKELEKREQLHRLVKKHTDFDKEVWDRIEFFYDLRCGLYHEESAKTLSDSSINEFYDIVEFTIDSLFNVDSRKYVKRIDDVFVSEIPKKVPINKIPEKINKIIIVVKESKPKNAEDIQEYMKKVGAREKIQIGVINKYLKDTYKYLFYFDREKDTWILSDEGERRYREITQNINNNNTP